VAINASIDAFIEAILVVDLSSAIARFSSSVRSPPRRRFLGASLGCGAVVFNLVGRLPVFGLSSSNSEGFCFVDRLDLETRGVFCIPARRPP
jgi:hypothetical protein